MWKTLALTFLFASVVTPVIVDVLRSVVHRKRKNLNSIGATQDISMWGSFIGIVFVLGTVLCGIGWYLTK
jgi:uncharacterized membrane protein